MVKHKHLYIVIVSMLSAAHPRFDRVITTESVKQQQLQQEIRNIQLYDVGTTAHQDISSLVLYDKNSFIEVEGQFGQGIFGSVTLLTPNSWW